MLRQDPLPFSRALGLWSAADPPSLLGIWWFEGQGVSAFWRPLPSLIIEASIRVLGEHAFPLHLLSITLHGLVGGTLFLLVRRLTGRPVLAWLAGLFFLSCEDHSMAVGWISTVTDLVCVLCINLSLMAHASWLDRRRASMLVASLVALVAALLSKESAVLAPVILALLTLLMPRGRDAELPPASVSAVRARVGGFLRDWVSWVPAMLLLVAYLIVYRMLGFGGISSGMYVDPIAHPVRFLAHLVEHLPVMWLASLSPVPPSLAMFLPDATTVLALAGALLFVLWLVALWWMRRSGLIVWALCLYVLALLPQMSTDASERGLYCPTLGSSILLAVLLMQIGPIARRASQGFPRAPEFSRVAGWVVAFVVLLPGIILSPVMPLMYMPSSERPGKDAVTIVPHVEERNPDHVLLLNTPGLFHTFYLGAVVDYHLGRHVDTRVLSSMNGIMSVERTGDRSFLLRTDRSGWLTNIFAGMLRSSRPPKPGRVYHKGLLTVTLAEMTPRGRDVLAVRFDLDRPLDDPSVLILHWDGTVFKPIDLATLPLGERVTLADTSDVMASMW
jgi:hypothetical protein